MAQTGSREVAVLIGHIDRCRGRYIEGWAIPTERGRRCRIEVKDSTGRVLAEDVASSHRDDLAALGQGRADFAFRVGVPIEGGCGAVHVWADGVEMPGSPLPFDDSAYDGVLTVAEGRVSGWVCSRGTRRVSKSLTLVDQDGRHVLTLPVEPDAAEKDRLFQPARFAAALPPQCFGQAEFCLTAKIGGDIVARSYGSCGLEGYLDSLTQDRFVGWLFCPDAPGKRLELCVYREGVHVGSTRTGIARDDVGRRYAGAGACGFDLRLAPGERTAAGLAHVSIRLAGAERELFGGPFLVGSRSQAVRTLYDAMARIAPDRPEAGVLYHALGQSLQVARTAEEVRIPVRARPRPEHRTQRLAVVIPVYADPAATRICIDSVLRTRRAGSDSIVLVNDNPGNQAIEAVVDGYADHPDVFVLRNPENFGFVASVNRALGFVQEGDVLLLNADAELYAGGLDEMVAILQTAPDIGTVTALSNNATLFSYPHSSMPERVLDDIAWQELAATALRENAGGSVEIPTGHGFCMLIRRATLREVGGFDTAFGRGYGEENDFCVRASDRGWRHVLAGGVLVRHDDGASFGDGKQALVEANLRVLSERFPEYQDRVSAFAAEDPVRTVRWPLDFHRLRRLRKAGIRLELVIENWLDGGMQRAASDIDAVVHTPDVHSLRVRADQDGTVTLTLQGLRMLSVFQPDDTAALFGLLETLQLDRVVVHHLLGFTEEFVRGLRRFIAGRAALFHVHDFYYACPRVTMIDASGRFCGGAAADRCARCVGLDGHHEAYRMRQLLPADHRALFADLLGGARHVVAPSEDTAERLRVLMPGQTVVAVPHPQTGMVFPIGVRRGSPTEICLLGAIGPHKGSALLLALARHARLNHPELRFHLVGFSDVDAALADVGNVSVTGRYEPDELAGLVEATGGRVALFLHQWPETFSYTLSEAVALGLIPVVPDIGAPAERVRAAGFGVIYPLPVDVAQLAALLLGIGSGDVPFSRSGALPRAFDTSKTYDRLRSLYHGGSTGSAPSPGGARRRKAASV